MRTVFARLLAKADMRQICIHYPRHTYSTLLVQAGAPITYVSQQPGHREASITPGLRSLDVLFRPMRDRGDRSTWALR